MKWTTTILASAIFAALSMVASVGWAGEAHKVAIHVDQNDPAVMNMALNNIQNLREYYEGKGESVEVELVTYGPGLKMLTADSPVKDRIATMGMEENVQFSACGNTLKGMEKKSGKEVKLLSEAKVVPSGVVRLIELQESGFAYVRP